MITLFTASIAWLTVGVCIFNTWLATWNYRTDLIGRYPLHYDALKRVGCSNPEHPVCLEINFFNQAKIRYFLLMTISGPLALLLLWPAQRTFNKAIFFTLDREVLGLNQKVLE